VIFLFTPQCVFILKQGIDEINNNVKSSKKTTTPPPIVVKNVNEEEQHERIHPKP
jgi:hypothetical protein